MQALTLTRSTRATLSRSTTAAAVGAAAVIALAGDGVVAIGLALLAATTAAYVDAREARIPDVLVVATLAPVVAHATALGLTGRPGVWLGLLIGAGLFALPILAVHLVAPAAMGFGDVKLAAALGAVCGLLSGSLAVVALAVASGATAAIGIVGRRSTVAFAPGLVLGSVAALSIGLWLGLEVPQWR